MASTSITERASNLAILATASLLALLLAWQLSNASSIWRGVMIVLLCLPGTLVLASLLRHRPRARAWTILGAIPYATLGIMESIANPSARLWAMACAALAFAQFVVLGWLLRVQARQR